MRIIETENSRYELDTVNKRIRRIEGKATPTDRQGPDMVWKDYVYLDRVAGGYFIDWDGEGHGTLTSQVVNEYEASLS